ncbi:protein atp12 [Diplogelasinospora grovesii]|uniref:Protein atp12 n=1 Tax=Diplogelasinospora grovesii TaxID=303347 RepID=A0AAN6NC75_9PEZI|nr:protein atp12 [Diplogelasinospora grovesii]
MAHTTRIPLGALLASLRPAPHTTSSHVTALTACSLLSRRVTRTLHSQSAQPAKVVPLYGTGPPPEPPLPSAEYVDSRIARRRKQAELLKQAKEIRSAASAKSGAQNKPLKRRFWQDVHVREVNGAYEIHLDSRPLRRPNSKEIIRLPLSKPHLAHALALEWDQLVSAQDATKQHLIPLTSLVCRALDIADDDAAHASSEGAARIRTAIATTLLRYLDTDSLLCWAPAADPHDATNPASALNDQGKSLRDLQEETAGAVVSFLTSRVWPGITIVPVLDESSILPRAQEPGTREVIQGWVLGLSSWELAGLERAVLAGKSLLGGARLVVEWSEGGAGTRTTTRAGTEQQQRFGVEEAARAASLEVDWQIGRWGEVEDTHDVEKHDVRRQLGSMILLVSGLGEGQSRR